MGEKIIMNICKNIKLYSLLFFVFAAGAVSGCSKDSSDAVSPTPTQTGFFTENGKKGFWFSGMKWFIKESTSIVGPGNNYFSGNANDIFIDAAGNLHMKISYRDNHWVCTEFYSEQAVTYGRYNFVIESGLDNLDPNVVLGLFTWDNNTYLTDANTEIDIEFSKWTDPKGKTLHYSVQPTFGPDVPSGSYEERNKQFNMIIGGKASYHSFFWTDTLIKFSGYFGHSVNEDSAMAKFEFSNKNPARTTNGEGTVTAPIIIPKPSATTRLHLNLWLVKGKNNVGLPPLYNNEVEIVISKIEYLKN